MFAHTLPFQHVLRASSAMAQASVLTFKESASVKAETVRVLCVEDDPLLRMLLSTKFDLSSVTYDFSEDGLKIPERVRAFKPSVILLDIMIGGVNGLDVLEEIKSCTDIEQIPVIIFSNQDSYEERKRAESLGAKLYLVKATTDLSDLIKILSSLSKP